MSTICISPQSGTESKKVGPSNEVTTTFELNGSRSVEFSYTTTAEEARRRGIAHSRNWFILLAGALALFSVVFGYAGLPYQPLVAVLIATVGIVVVLAMKAAGK